MLIWWSLKEKIRWGSFISFSLVFLFPLLPYSFAFNHFPRAYIFAVTKPCTQIINVGNYFSLEGTAEIKYLDFKKMFLFLLYRVIMHPINVETWISCLMLCIPQSLYNHVLLNLKIHSTFPSCLVGFHDIQLSHILFPWFTTKLSMTWSM